MIKTAAELRYSETAFIKQKGEKSFYIRYFTPTEEVDLCGHATIGSFGALLDAGKIHQGQLCELITKAGTLEVEMKGNTVFMEMGEAVDLGGVQDVVQLKTKEVLMRMKPDFPALSKLSEELQVVGVHAFALSEEPGIRAVCRNFAPLYGIDEEAATGTSNGALTYYLYKQGVIKQGDASTFLQGESMGRPSKIHTILDCNDSTKVTVGGTFKILAKGDLFI